MLGRITQCTLKCTRPRARPEGMQNGHTAQAYWAARLLGKEPQLSLPTDRSRGGSALASATNQVRCPAGSVQCVVWQEGPGDPCWTQTSGNQRVAAVPRAVPGSPQCSILNPHTGLAASAAPQLEV